ncbi:MAG TPA: TIGR03435 family protein [Bryobacteraceae bacterium]
MSSSRAAMFLLLINGTIFAQNNAAVLRFEVASVRPAKHGQGPHGTPLVVNHGRVTLDDASLRQIIGHAYGVQRVRVLNCPSWCDSEGFDVVAKAENPDATQDQIRQMLQTLLLERFKLAAHREKGEMQMYALVVGKHGPKLRDGRESESSDDLASLISLLAV